MGGGVWAPFGAWCCLWQPRPPPDQLHFSQLEKDKVRAEKPQVLDRSTWASPRGAPGEARVNQAVALATPHPGPRAAGGRSFPECFQATFPVVSLLLCIFTRTAPVIPRSLPPSQVFVHECAYLSVARVDRTPFVELWSREGGLCG